MSNSTWPNHWTFRIPPLKLSLPLVKVNDNLSIYSFNMMGKSSWNQVMAEALDQQIHQQIQKEIQTTKAIADAADFSSTYVFVTAESKAIALTEQLATLNEMPQYVVLRKSAKAYMKNPLMVETKSITTESVQRLYLDREDLKLIKNKRVIIVDDVVSTGGTMDAIMALAKKAEFTIFLIACVLIEGEWRDRYRDIPLVKLGHLPLPQGPYNPDSPN
jgi:adenine phosphoribosyltransferase